MDIREIADDIVAREGGFVNDPDDPGGPTKHGVTIHTLRRLGLDLTGDATALFLQHYYHAPRIDRLPEALQPSVFDMYVNAGANAVRLLQELVSEMGFETAADGVIGPLTLRAVRAAWEAAPDHLVDAYGIARRNYYYRIGDRRPASRKYARRKDGGKGGWITRAEAFMAPRFHLTEAAHRARVAAWD